MKNLSNHGRPRLRIKTITKVKIGLGLIIIILLLVGINEMWKAVDNFYDNYYFQRNKIVTVIFKKPIEIKKREQIINIIQEVPNPEDLNTEPEQLIYKYFGIENYRMAIAVSKCEGLNHPADGFNTNTNGTIDVGYMRINSVNFKIEGCSLLEVATPEGNIACGYKLWDRGDGIEGNEKGNFNAWVGYTNGCALTKYE